MSDTPNTTQSSDVALRACMEALLFVSADGIRVSRLANICGADVDDVIRVARDASPTADASAMRGLCMIVHDDTVQMVTCPAQQSAVDTLVQQERDDPLSTAALEVLAIVAYRGPITRADIDAIRGVNCGSSLRRLMMRGLVERVRDTENSRIIRYRVTRDILAHLGVARVEDLPSYAELSTHEKLESITHDTQ